MALCMLWHCLNAWLMAKQLAYQQTFTCAATRQGPFKGLCLEKTTLPKPEPKTQKLWFRNVLQGFRGLGDWQLVIDS